MIKHCHNCSKCCEVIALDNVTHERFAELLSKGKLDPLHGEMMRPISREEALKRNAYIVEGRDKLREITKSEGETSYYTCTKLVDNKCSIYADRPIMCSGYPFYGKFPDENVQSHAWLSKTQFVRKEAAYSPTCTYVPDIIPVRNISI